MKTITRRTALKLLASTPAAAAMAWTPAEAEQAHEHAQESRRIAAARGVSYKPKFFTAHEYSTIGVLVDLIIPKDDRSGSATEAGVPEFMDFMMIDDPKRQTAMRGGLALVDHLCEERFDKTFLESADAERRRLLDDIAFPARAPGSLSHAVTFFSSFRDLTASGFWTTKMGIADLQYQGNTFVREWNGCPQEALAKLNVAYAAAAQSSSTWRTLFDGRSLDAWRGYRSDTIPAGWHIAGGTLAKEAPVADIMSKDQFGDFELELEWKIGEAGNSGIFYRGTEEYDHIYWSAPEYQLLDDIKGADNKTRLTCAGAAYGLYPSPPGHLKRVGEWNTTRILANGAHVEHWLNGIKLLEYELWSPDWEAKVKASKFAVWPNFGRAKRGHIAMQGDHPGTLAFRSIRIR
ncbi:MAG TPA: family 16 glycoside hydrolase [Terriglobia bacterium]|nr:family 16 glycoside hydrolase [Terriglobia bacterium]